ncbi:protein kinase [Streptomyces sp. NPDC059382]|uniref:protein kinase domain-containing protein n=1 Tax=Streptomyces sp. NPDC059382 TaxID=3346816 RepID=UPI0036B9BAC7
MTGAEGVREVIDDRYELEELLGRGGFGEVWRARDARVGRRVAVKIGYPETVEAARRFEREASLAGNLAHPDIATIHDFGRTEHDGRDAVFLVMELLRGRSLAEVLDAGVSARGCRPRWTPSCSTCRRRTPGSVRRPRGR